MACEVKIVSKAEDIPPELLIHMFFGKSVSELAKEICKGEYKEFLKNE